MIVAIVIVVVVILIKFFISITKDNNELEGENLYQKFNYLIETINSEVFNGRGNGKLIDSRTFYLSNDKNSEYVQFFYSSGSMNLKHSVYCLDNEVKSEKTLTNIRKIDTETQVDLAKSFIEQIGKKLMAYKAMSKNECNQIPQNNQKQIEYLLSLSFYEFCFSQDIAKSLLDDSNETFKLVLRALEIEKNEVVEENIILRMYLTFLQAKYEITPNLIIPFIYIYNDYSFLLTYSTMKLFKEDSLHDDDFLIEFENHDYFAVLSNNFENVENDKGDIEFAVANALYLYVKEDKPTALFVLVYDQVVKSESVRRVYPDGKSENLGFIKKGKCFNFLKAYVLMKFQKKNF